MLAGETTTGGVLVAAGSAAWCVVLLAATVCLVHHVRGTASPTKARSGANDKLSSANSVLPASGAPVSAHSMQDSSAEARMQTRAELARRRAEQGSLVCHVCGFENFADARRCGVCDGASGLVRPQSGVLEPMPCSSAQDSRSGETADADTFDGAAHLRARKRKEWSRRMDTRGRRLWHRTKIVGHDDYSPGYVVRFAAKKPSRQPQREPEPIVDDAVTGASRSVDYDELANLRLDLLETTVVDPIQFPNDGMDTSVDCIIARERMLNLAVDMDFPSKYAYFVNHAMKVQSGERINNEPVGINADFLLNQGANVINIELQKPPVSVSTASAQTKWQTELRSMLVNPLVGLFRCANHPNRAYFINPTAATALGGDHLQYYLAAGQFIGRSLLNGERLDFHFCVPLLKMMLGMPISFSDLEYLDEETYRNLSWLLDNDGVEELELDFTVNERGPSGEVRTVELIPAGRNIQVNDDNKYEYIDRKFRYALFESVSPQVCVFLKGFYETVPAELLMLFDYEELDYLLCHDGATS